MFQQSMLAFAATFAKAEICGPGPYRVYEGTIRETLKDAGLKVVR